MRMSINTTSSGSGRVGDVQSHPKGEIRVKTKLVVNFPEEEALQIGLEQEAKELRKTRGEVCAKTQQNALWLTSGLRIN